jgi:hypothetical protein
MPNAFRPARLKIRLWASLVLLGDLARRYPMRPRATLTHDEYKASEAAFQGLPLDPKWSTHAQEIYLGILEVTKGKDIVNNEEAPPLTSERNSSAMFEIIDGVVR